MNRLDRLRTILLRVVKAVISINNAKPSFLIIGTQKGGTTSLFHYLQKHPNVLSPEKKEIQYFSWNYRRGLLWYRSFFPKKKNNKIAGEASPDYLFHPYAAKRAYEYNPNFKIIVLLREPIDRALSQYHHEINKNKHFKYQDFQDAIFKESLHFKEEWKFYMQCTEKLLKA